MGDWVPYVPEVVQGEPPTTRTRGRRFITPMDGDPFFVFGEYDDGNGMWIVTGVSPCGQKNPVVTIPCP
jgi:hypothetical protein